MPRDWPHSLDPEPTPTQTFRWKIEAAVLAGLIATSTGAAAWSLVADKVAGGEPISGCQVTDGDTIRCGDERIRLLGIDAPELPGHCRRGRRCAPGDPVASTNALCDDLVGEVRIVRVGEDRYGRTLATMSTRVGDLSCRQLARGAAVYRADWDDGGRIAATCPQG